MAVARDTATHTDPCVALSQASGHSCVWWGAHSQWKRKNGHPEQRHIQKGACLWFPYVFIVFKVWSLLEYNVHVFSMDLALGILPVS